MPVRNLYLQIMKKSPFRVQNRGKHVRTALRWNHLRRRLERDPRGNRQLNNVRPRLPRVILALLIFHQVIGMRYPEFLARNEQQLPRRQRLTFLLDKKHGLIVAHLRSPKRLPKHHPRPRPLRFLRIVGHQHQAAADHSQHHSKNIFYHYLCSPFIAIYAYSLNGASFSDQFKRIPRHWPTHLQKSHQRKPPKLPIGGGMVT